MRTAGLKSGLKKALRIPLYPVLRYFGPRFNTISQQIDRLGNEVKALRESTMPAVGNFSQFERRVYTDLETIVEFAMTLQRSSVLLDQRLRELRHLLTFDVGKRLAELDPAISDYAAHLIVGGRVNDLGPGTAELLNWATAGDNLGFSAQQGLWFNPPITVEHRPGEVALRYVNERIVEVPYAMAAAGGLPTGSRVLDVGSAESTLALSLASIGLQVTAIDSRPYPLTHPNMDVVISPIEEWEGPKKPLDAIFCISTIEHLGVGAYGQSPADPKLDRKVIELMSSWLSPKGELVLTTPYGDWSMDSFQRVYDAYHLELLLEGWSVLDRRICVQTDDLVWETVTQEPDEHSWEAGRRGVVLLRARPGI